MRNLKTEFLDIRLSVVLPFNFICLGKRDQRSLPWHKHKAEFYCWSCPKALKRQYFSQYKRTVEVFIPIFLILKIIQSAKSVLNSSAKLPADELHSCTSPAGAMGPAHQLHTVIHPSLLNCPLIYETSLPQSKVKCSLVSTCVNHSWNKGPVCILVVCERVRGEYRTP